MVKNPPALRETWVRPLGWEDPLEKGTATHSSILAWRIPWIEYSRLWDEHREPGRDPRVYFRLASESVLGDPGWAE